METKNKQRMNREYERLATFHLWLGAAKSLLHVLDLASCGLYYEPLSGQRDRVVCFFCDVSLAEWTSEHDIERRHQTESPDCPLLRGHATSNVPLQDPTGYSIIRTKLSADHGDRNDMDDTKQEAQFGLPPRSEDEPKEDPGTTEDQPENVDVELEEFFSRGEDNSRYGGAAMPTLGGLDGFIQSMMADEE